MPKWTKNQLHSDVILGTEGVSQKQNVFSRVLEASVVWFQEEQNCK
jgi:hypothetical protein